MTGRVRSALAAGALAASIHGAARAQDSAAQLTLLQQSLEASLATVGEAAVGRLHYKRVAPLSILRTAQTQAAETRRQAGLLTGPRASSIHHLATKIVHRVDKTILLLNDPESQPGGVDRQLVLTMRAGGKIALLLPEDADSGPLVVLEDSDPAHGGFRASGDRACFRVHVLEGAVPCAAPVVRAENLPPSLGDQVLVDDLTPSSATDWCVTMGPDRGGARITATACGASGSLFLFSVGPK